jgi:hypothetical protein
MNAWSVLCNSSSVEGRLTRDKRKEALTQAMAKEEDEEKKNRREAENSLQKRKVRLFLFSPLLNNFIICPGIPHKKKKNRVCFSAVRGKEE